MKLIQKIALKICSATILYTLFLSASHATTPLVFYTEFSPHGFHAPFYLAQQKGWYDEAGLQLTIRDGKGTANTISLVGAGQADVGLASLGAMAIAQAKGVPVIAIASLMRQNSYGLVMKQGAGIKTPADLKGKQVVFNTASIEPQLLEGYLAAGGVKSSDLKLVGVESSAKVATVLTGKADAAVGPIPYYRGLLEGKERLDYLPFSDAGQVLLDFGLVTNTETLKKKHDALQAFVKVTARAFEYTLNGHEEEAVNALIAARPEAGLDFQTSVNMFKSHARHIPSPNTQGKPFGYMDKQDWEKTIETLRSVKLVPASASAAAMYTTELMPQ